MRRLLMMIVSLMICVFAVMGQYTVEDVSGNVTIRKGGHQTAVSKGMSLTPMDELTLAPGACVKIYNKSEAKSYTWTKEGMSTVQTIRIEAGKAAESIGQRLGNLPNTFVRPMSGNQGYVYVESGMVKRSMASYDPAAQNIEVDPEQMADYIIAELLSGDSGEHGGVPTTFSHERNDAGGLIFSIENTLQNPIYFNVIKVDSENKVQISEIGQPSGSYVLLPSQTLSRGQLSALADKHILVMAHFNFDIDKLIENVEEKLKTEMVKPQLQENMGIYVTRL